MSAEIALIPNLGAEEPGDWRRHHARGHATPGVVTTTALWRCLFPAAHRLLDVEDPGIAHAWPESLGERPTEAAFGWIDAKNTEATAWLADANAHALAHDRGLTLAGCAPAIGERVHDKAFALEVAERDGYLPRALRGLIRAFTAEALARAESFIADLEGVLAGWPEWTGGRFTLKPRRGTSGRGRLAGNAATLDRDGIAQALPRFARCGGLILEPWLERETDYSVLFHVAPPTADTAAPALTLIGALEQRTTPSGLCIGHLAEIDSSGRVFTGGAHEEALREAGAALATRAREAGYIGPCGIDAFSFRLDTDGETRSVLRPLVEFNARFTLGIVAIGLIRRALATRPPPLGLAPGERRSVLFALAPPYPAKSWSEARSALTGPVEIVSLAPEQPDAAHARDAAQPALIFAQDRETLAPLLTQRTPR